VLLGLISSLVFRAARDTLPHDPVAQERIIGASLTALAIADVSSLFFLLHPRNEALSPSLGYPVRFHIL
jgi:hypothetical protein